MLRESRPTLTAFFAGTQFWKTQKVNVKYCATKMSNSINVSFDSVPINEDSDNLNPSLLESHSRCQVQGSLLILGNLTHKSNEHILNTIMRQADHEGVMETLAYPNRTVWIRNNLPGWFGNCGVLSQ